MAFLADGELAERALNRASLLDREHKGLGAAREKVEAGFSWIKAREIKEV